jgi:hypothetical protein
MPLFSQFHDPLNEIWFRNGCELDVNDSNDSVGQIPIIQVNEIMMRSFEMCQKCRSATWSVSPVLNEYGADMTADLPLIGRS